MNVDIVDIERMAKETGISELLIYECLGKPSPRMKELGEQLQSAKTTPEALTVYLNAQKGSSLKAEALTKTLAFVKNVDEAKMVHYKAPEGSVLKVEALKKLETLLRPQLDSAETVDEVQEIYSVAPSGSPLETEALKKLSTFFLIEEKVTK